jgi:hypothetical protein
MSLKKPRPRRRKVTASHIGAIRDALDHAHIIAADHREAGAVLFDQAGRALDRIATALFGTTAPPR